jgi:hypothetical protein
VLGAKCSVLVPVLPFPPLLPSCPSFFTCGPTLVGATTGEEYVENIPGILDGVDPLDGVDRGFISFELIDDSRMVEVVTAQDGSPVDTIIFHKVSQE